uniref:Uncharacterized protein n=1 Tax=Opuntia streptacantha TaxID=393608 RepID=A0A7C9A7A8_OPUST
MKMNRKIILWSRPSSHPRHSFLLSHLTHKPQEGIPHHTTHPPPRLRLGFCHRILESRRGRCHEELNLLFRVPFGHIPLRHPIPNIIHPNVAQFVLIPLNLVLF